MAIFSRRAIQRELDSLRPDILKPDREKDVISRLNSRRRQAIAAEWEVVILASFSRISEVAYETQFGPVRPDLFVRTKAGAHCSEFLADVVAVSDEEITKKNPAGYFFSEFRRVAAKFGRTNGGFDIRIGSRELGKYPDKRQQLQLPTKGEIPQFIQREFSHFLSRVRSQSQARHTASSKRAGVDVSITYDPAGSGSMTGGYATCQAPFSLRRNPLFKALNDKATKLKLSGYAGLKGVIVVDGDCCSLSSSRSGSGWSTDQIVEDFLRAHSYVGFVTLSHYENRSSWTKTEHGLSHKVYWQHPFDESVTSNLLPLFTAAFATLPPVYQAPHNAWLDIRSGNGISSGCQLGSYSRCNSRRIGYSSRTFLSLVAGALSQHEFSLLILDRYPCGGPFFQFFASLHRSKGKLGQVLIQAGDWDDDFIVFDLDAAQKTPTPSKITNRGLELFCDVPATDLVRYFALLAHEVASKRERFSIGTLPVDVQQPVRNQMRDGRTLMAAALVDSGHTIRLVFGERDAAVSEYF